MPATADAMQTAHGMQEPPPAVKEWWASPAVVGLMGFGTTTMLAGLANLPDPYGSDFVGNASIFGMAMAFGGTAQFAAGLIGLRKGNLFAGSAFIGYGSFWWAYTLFLLWIPTPAAAGTGFFYQIAAFAFIWMLFTFAFMINAPKHGIGVTAVFVLLWIAYILLTYKFFSLGGGNTTFTGTNSANWAVGGEIILTGLVAWFVAMADLTNWNYGRRIIPV